ncbi:TetR/AcrR family transcriptional regulator [Streptomyces europaeiscabiei]|uniref:TetR/AcrR family transcriptional regulator n=1 Tax=Streptomyces europaeiscabiei TaxID=146819 RepID=UPI0029A0A9B1|nr:helix-turn-helix domain-containing protein [Streptomyces europaeiscabiei]MDX3586375.1 helix-turn-helix domain containing protein [Streptomyces europaeiscabiei]
MAVNGKPDLRERRRLATQADIEDAALDLFERQGYEHTTVLEIAAAAGVSQSTFFRHFATKEDAALGPNRAFESALVARLDGAESLTLRGIEDVVAGVLGDLSTDPTDVLGRMRRVGGLLMRDMALRSAALRREVEQCQRFLRLLADAAGSETVDLRARVMAGTVSATLRAAFDEWASRRAPEGEADLVEVYRTTCARVRDVVSG